MLYQEREVFFILRVKGYSVEKRMYVPPGRDNFFFKIQNQCFLAPSLYLMMKRLQLGFNEKERGSVPVLNGLLWAILVPLLLFLEVFDVFELNFIYAYQQVLLALA